MKYILILLLLTSFTLKDIPASKLFWELHKQKNVIGEYDCSNKCGIYARELARLGYKVQVIIILPHKGKYLHAVVKIIKDGQYLYLDPTVGIINRDLNAMGLLIKVVPFKDLDKLGKEFE